MNLLRLSIILNGISMAIVYFAFDIFHLIQTPLTPYGVNHWIPELFTIFFIGIYLFKKFSVLIRLSIVFCIGMFPPITEGIIYGFIGIIHGIGTGALYVGTVLTGMWVGIEISSRKKRSDTQISVSK